MLRFLTLTVALTLPACGAEATPEDNPPDWSETIAATDYDPEKENALPRPPLPSRDLDDIVPGCGTMNPKERPRGSNCFGIFPEQCGADQMEEHIGETMTPALVRKASEMSVGGLRVIRPLQATNDDFRAARMNVFLDEEDRIKSLDCH